LLHRLRVRDRRRLPRRPAHWGRAAPAVTRRRTSRTASTTTPAPAPCVPPVGGSPAGRDAPTAAVASPGGDGTGGDGASSGSVTSARETVTTAGTLLAW